MIVELVDPQPTDIIADPASGTYGFQVAAGKYLREHHSKLFHNKKQKEHFASTMFHGMDFDASMLPIGAMNLMLHGVEKPDIKDLGALSQDGAEIRDRYTIVLANPPFKGSLNYEEVAKDLLQVSCCSLRRTTPSSFLPDPRMRTASIPGLGCLAPKSLNINTLRLIRMGCLLGTIRHFPRN